MLLQAIREELVTLNRALPENGLVKWTSGNVSIRDTETGRVAIKPSGGDARGLNPGEHGGGRPGGQRHRRGC